MSDQPSPIEQFMYWQCRIRQESVRVLDGRPTTGMQPEVSLIDSGDSLGKINTLITKSEPESYTTEFRHIVRKTQDPTDRIRSGLRVLAEAYYQQSRGFSTELKALFAMDSDLAKKLLDVGSCRLLFAQDAHRHELCCSIRDIPESDSGYQAIYWHNHMFNPSMPGKVKVLGFLPE